MTTSPPLLTRRAVVLAGVETTYNVDPGLSPLTQALLVDAPDYTADITLLERNYARPSISPLPHLVGRKLAKLGFTIELRGNGSENSGLLANAPPITTLLQGCGFQLQGIAAASSTIVYDVGVEGNEVTWAQPNVTGATNTDLVAYYVTVTTGGASGAAMVTVTSDTAGEGSGPTVLTSGTAFALGTKGLHITPTFAGNLSVGQAWSLWALPPGILANPISNNFASLTLYCYYDGTFHKITGAQGTFTLTADGGQYAKLKFEFTGQYYSPVDAALPTPAFDRALPAEVQLARLQIDGFAATVMAFTYTHANDIQPRPDVNAADGYNGVRIVSRKPTGGIDPEATLVATHDFWGRLVASKEMPFQMRCGLVPGNTVWILAPQVQYTKMTYKDRQGIRAYDAGLHFPGFNGDDELLLHFA